MSKKINLFAVYVGGKTPTSLIEVHDMQFVLGEKIEDTYAQLQKKWWGVPKSLHLDAWGIVDCVDGFDVILKSQPPTNILEKLYFVNLGGYDKNEFTELHKNMFVVAQNENAAKLKAKATVAHWQVPHKDYLFELDDCVAVSDILDTDKFYIHLQLSKNPRPFSFTCKYTPIG